MGAHRVIKVFKNVFVCLIWTGLFIWLQLRTDDIVTASLIYVSVLLFWVPFACVLSKKLGNRLFPEKHHRTTDGLGIVFSLALFFSILSLRFAVRYFEINGNINWLVGIEEVFNGFLTTTKTFGVDDKYPEFLASVKEMLASIFNKNGWQFDLVNFAAVIHTSILFVSAPVVSGTVIIKILTDISPKLSLVCKFAFSFWRRYYYFSELNAASLALAKSIRKSNKNSVLIFTDTYIDKKKEKENELLLDAKLLGAVCIRDDLAHVIKPRLGRREYYLMDENEIGNLQTLMSLVDLRNLRYIKSSRIYLFVDSDSYVQVEKQINAKFSSDKYMKKVFGKDSEKPVIIPVNRYRNLVHNLFSDVPLYEPLIGKTDVSRLRITILGNGDIGTEAFLSAYCLGRMLVEKDGSVTECEIDINVISKDDEAEFWSKIDYINPEIKETAEVVGEERKEPRKLLCYNKNGDENKPYCRVKYVQKDVLSAGLHDGEIQDSDYIIVALGSDEDNISVAEKLRLAVGKRHLASEDGVIHNTVIAYAVFDSALCEMLNVQKLYSSRKNGRADIFMHAFGSLGQVYGCENVYMSQSSVLAEETGRAYLRQRHLEANADRLYSEDKDNSNYSYWADLARAGHMKYKVFSLGWIKSSVFNCADEAGLDSHRKNVKSSCALYRKLSLAEGAEKLSEEEKQKYAHLEDMKHCLAALEHRRWCAFTRVLGYRYIDVNECMKHTESHKNMSLKLHSCLVESYMPTAKGDAPSEPDLLDGVSSACGKDFKKYDYHYHEFCD